MLVSNFLYQQNIDLKLVIIQNNCKKLTKGSFKNDTHKKLGFLNVSPAPCHKIFSQLMRIFYEFVTQIDSLIYEQPLMITRLNLKTKQTAKVPAAARLYFKTQKE